MARFTFLLVGEELLTVRFFAESFFAESKTGTFESASFESASFESTDFESESSVGGFALFKGIVAIFCSFVFSRVKTRVREDCEGLHVFQIDQKTDDMKHDKTRKTALQVPSVNIIGDRVDTFGPSGAIFSKNSAKTLPDAKFRTQ